MASSVINSDDGVISGTAGLKSSGGDDGNLVFQSKGTETARINTDKQIVAAAGTASLPALTTTGDLNTGIFFPAADTIAFAEGGAEAMRIDSSGNVGIGSTATGGARLYVDGGNVSNAGQWASSAIAISNTTNANTYSQISFGYVASTTNAPAYIGYLNTDSAGNGRGSLVFGTRNVTTDTQPTERARIDSSGNLLVGTTSQSDQGKGTIAFNGSSHQGLNLRETANQVSAGFMYFNQGGTILGTITRNGGTNAILFNTTSDIRLKENIEYAEPALEKVSNIKVRQYDWIGANYHQEYGFVAQELAEVVPDVVTKGRTEEDTWAVDYGKLTPILVKAIQELSAKNDALEARISALEAVPGNE